MNDLRGTLMRRDLSTRRKDQSIKKNLKANWERGLEAGKMLER